MAQTVDLADVLDASMQQRIKDLWAAMPGRIVSYDPKKQTANVQITVKWGVIEENGKRFADTIPVLNSLPVVFLGGGEFRTVYPVKAGDTALVVFCTRSLSQWLARGGVVDPGTDHHHHLNDGVVLVGLRDFPHALKRTPTDRMSIGSDTGATIEIHANEVRVGGDVNAKPTLRGPDYLQAELNFTEALTGVIDALADAIAALASAAGLGLSPTIVAVAGQKTAFEAAANTFGDQAAASLTTVARLV